MIGPRIAFIGAGSTVFMTNIIGDVLQREALKGAHVALMDINAQRLKESEIVFEKLVASLDVPATHSMHTDQREALVDALIEAHGDWLPGWLSGAKVMRVA